jgi:peptide/nickel transport system permease protein
MAVAQSQTQAAAQAAAPKPRSPGRLLVARLLRRRIVVASLVLLAVIVGSAILAPWVAPYGPTKMDIVNRLKPPSLAHLFGADDFGRDVLTRTLYGARISLTVGLLVVVLASLLGTLLGLFAGYIRKLDAALMRFTDALMAFPDILLAIALLAGLGPSLFNVVLALGIVYTPRVARVVRGATLVLRELQFIEAAAALGASDARIMIVHLLPNLVSPLIVQGTFIFAYAILTEAALSFLGAGVPPTTPTWGNMIAGAQQYMNQADWLIMAPGLAIVLTVLSLQILGDGLRDALDPKLQRLM